MTDKNKQTIVDGNEAVANVVHKLIEIAAIYPITPSSTMAEVIDKLSSQGIENLWGMIPKVIELQSEGGASGTLHGALQLGALATTFTASQGLLLMIPNMFKIAGELMPTVMHVSARAIATQALSIFGDFSDVMAARSTGWAMLCSANVQETQDMAVIAHAATLASRIPFIHFFEGFRISHEINKIEALSDEMLRSMIDEELVLAHKNRALNPNRPFIRGTSQNPDVYFQSRETVNPFYAMIPSIVTSYMQRFARLTGREYHLVDYYGDADAERVIVIMGAGVITAQETVKYLQSKGEKVGLVKISLFRPFPVEQFLEALPNSVKAIAVLDRTKESGAPHEPLCQDVIDALRSRCNIKIVGGRYGLGSKEFTPTMVKSIFDELKNTNPRDHFTIGIEDDVSHLSLSYDKKLNLPLKETEAIFYGLGADGTVSANKNTIKIIGKETDLYVQGYFVYDSKKSGSQTTSHLRFGTNPINAPYLVYTADFIGCHQFPFVEKIDFLRRAKMGATLLLNSPFSAEKVWPQLPRQIQQEIINKKIKFYVIDAYKIANDVGLGSRINTIMQTCFFALTKILPIEKAIEKIKAALEHTYSYKGKEVIEKNFTAVDAAYAGLKQVQVPENVSPDAHDLMPLISNKAPEFVKNVTARLIQDLGDDIPVSALPIDGTYPSATSRWEKRNVSPIVSSWNPDLCIQCGQCSFVCPHSVIRAKHYPEELAKNAPPNFKKAKLREKKYGDNQMFTLQMYLEDCTGCGLCHVVCPGISKTDPKEKSVMLKPKAPVLETERENIAFFETLPVNDRRDIDPIAPRSVQYLEPLFEFSGACAGCGETPYVRLLSQLFGDRMLVANATGCTSIYGGNLPTTPWAFNKEGRGPAWANSLFEDNAEFGLGYSLAEELNFEQAFKLLNELRDAIGSDLVASLEQGFSGKDEQSIHDQRERVQKLTQILEKNNDPRAIKLLSLADHLVRRSIWIIGGDGWAYDIGYGGLDHVLASGHKVNVLVVDTEVYSNTGGQASKSTPRSAVAKFAASGKSTARKDLGLMMMPYGNIYIAQVAFGANSSQTLRALKEAENYNGPSLIIAYSHCISHGFEMSKGIDQQKLAVKSGFWPLYRYNPDRKAQGLNPLEIDSPEPTISFKEYAYNEPRFSSLARDNSKLAEELLAKAEKDVKERWAFYKKLAQ